MKSFRGFVRLFASLALLFSLGLDALQPVAAMAAAYQPPDPASITLQPAASVDPGPNVAANLAVVEPSASEPAAAQDGSRLLSAYARDVDLGSGRRQYQVGLNPLNYQAEDGSWQPIDARFKVRDGSFVNNTNLLDITAGGRRAVLRLESGAHTLGWGAESLGWLNAAGGYTGLAFPLDETHAAAGVLAAEGQRIEYQSNWSLPGLSEWIDTAPGSAEHSLVFAAPPPQPASGAAPAGLALRSRLLLPQGARLFANSQVQTGAFTTRGEVTVQDASGQMLLRLAPPFAYEQDDPGARTAGSYRLAPVTAREWQVDVETPWDWWQASARRYPVVLDPTFYVYTPTARTFVNTSGVCSLPDPFEESGSGYTLWLGRMELCAGMKYRVALKFALPTVPPGAVLEDAKLRVAPTSGYYYEIYNESSGWSWAYPNTTIDLHRINVAWDHTTAWGGYYPDLNPQTSASMKVKPPDKRPADTPFFVSTFSLSLDMIEDWLADPTKNHGVELRLHDEGIYENQLFTLPLPSAWSSSDKKNTSADQSEGGGFMLLITYTAPLLQNGVKVFTENLPTAAADKFGNIAHAYRANDGASTWNAVVVKGIRKIVEDSYVLPKVAGNPRIEANKISTVLSEGSFNNKSNYVLHRDVDINVRVPAFDESGGTHPEFYEILARRASAFAGGATFNQGISLSETFAFSATNMLQLYDLNLVAGTKVLIKTDITPTMPRVKLFEPGGSALRAKTDAYDSGATIEFVVPDGKTGVWALVVEHEGDAIGRPGSSEPPATVSLHGSIQVAACGPNQVFTKTGGCQVVRLDSAAECKNIQSKFSVYSQSGAFIPDGSGFHTAGSLAFIGPPGCPAAPARAVLVVDTPVYVETSGVIWVLENWGRVSLEKFNSSRISEKSFPAWTSPWHAEFSGANAGRIRPDSPGLGNMPVSDSEAEFTEAVIDVAGQYIRYTAPLERTVNAQEVTHPNDKHTYTFNLTWDVMAEGYGGAASLPVSYVSGPSQAEFGTLNIRIDNAAWKIDYLSGGRVGQFTELRTTGKAVLPDDLGAAWKPVQVVIQDNATPYDADDQPSIDYQCLAGNCLDIRHPTLDGPGNLNRSFDMPDITLSGNAKTVIFSEPGEMAVYSSDQPEAVEEVSVPFSYRTFNAVVTVERGLCPSTGQIVTLFRGEGDMALPGLGSDTDMGPKLRAEFMLCGTALDELLLSLQGVPVPVGSTGLFVTGLTGEMRRVSNDDTRLTLKVDFAADASASLTNGFASVTIDTNGMFELGVEGNLVQLVDYSGRAWVSWNPLDLGMSLEGGMDLWILHIQASISAHAWRGQGWQNQYSWLPDDGAMHVAASLGATVTIPDGELWDEWGISIPDGDWDLVSVSMLFGQFHTGCTGCYQWGVQATVEHYLYTLGFDVGLYLGYPSSVDIVLGSSDHYLIDQPPGMALTAEVAAVEVDPLAVVAAAQFEPYTLYAGGQPVESRRAVYPGPDAPNATWPFTVTAQTSGFLVGLGWENLAANPSLVLVRPDKVQVTIANGNSYGVKFVKSGVPGSDSTTRVMASAKNPMLGRWEAKVNGATGSDLWHLSFALNQKAPGLSFTKPIKPAEAWSNKDLYSISWQVASSFPAPDEVAVNLYYTATLSTGEVRSGPVAENVPYGNGTYLWNMTALPAGVYQVSAQLIKPQQVGRLTPYNGSQKGQWLIPSEVFVAPGTLNVSDPSAPAKPTGLTLTPLDEAFKLCWKPNTEKDLKGYVMQWTAPNVNGTLLVRNLNIRPMIKHNPNSGWPAIKECARIGGLVAGDSVTSIRVRAYDVNDKLGPWSDATSGSAIQGAPEEAPESGTLDVRHVAGSTDFILEWTGAADPITVAGYLVYYGVDTPAGPGQEGGGASGGKSPIDVGKVKNYTVSGLPVGRYVNFVIRSYDGAGRLGPVTNQVGGWVSTGESKDGDLTPDDWEKYWGLSDREPDPDKDNLLNVCAGLGKPKCEHSLGTNPYLPDSDFDGFTDGDEANAGTDPTDPNSFPDREPFPWLVLERNSLNFYAGTLGKGPAAQTVGVYNRGGGHMSLNVASSAAWLKASLLNGVLTVSVNPAGLKSGMYVGTITLSAASGQIVGNAPQKITVVLTVYQGMLYAQPNIYLPVVRKASK